MEFVLLCFLCAVKVSGLCDELITRTEESYRVCVFVYIYIYVSNSVWSTNLKNEAVWVRFGRLRYRKNGCLYVWTLDDDLSSWVETHTTIHNSRSPRKMLWRGHQCSLRSGWDLGQTRELPGIQMPYRSGREIPYSDHWVRKIFQNLCCRGYNGMQWDFMRSDKVFK